MFSAVLVNGVLGLGFIIALLFNMGSVQAALTADTTYPIIEIFYNITRSRPAATAMTCSLVTLASLAVVPGIAASSRMLWALSRDNGKPFLLFPFQLDP